MPLIAPRKNSDLLCLFLNIIKTKWGMYFREVLSMKYMRKRRGICWVANNPICLDYDGYTSTQHNTRYVKLR